MEEPAGSNIPEVADVRRLSMIIVGSRGSTDLKGLIIGRVPTVFFVQLTVLFWWLSREKPTLKRLERSG